MKKALLLSLVCLFLLAGTVRADTNVVISNVESQNIYNVGEIVEAFPLVNNGIAYVSFGQEGLSLGISGALDAYTFDVPDSANVKNILITGCGKNIYAIVNYKNTGLFTTPNKVFTWQLTDTIANCNRSKLFVPFVVAATE